jgi:hypothetical protein
MTSLQEKLLENKVRKIYNKILKEETLDLSSNERQIINKLKTLAEQETDILNPSRQAMVYSIVAEFLQNRALNIKKSQ